MKKFTTMLGATLLEVMLVLAVAAMIIVMSVRYYQTATTNQQVNSALSIVQGIIAAADGLAQGSGSYSTASVGTASIAPLMPAGVKDPSGNTMNSPWGGTVTVTGATSSTFVITFNSMTQAVCSLVKARVTASTKMSTSSTCASSTGNDLVITYNNAG